MSSPPGWFRDPWIIQHQKSGAKALTGGLGTEKQGIYVAEPLLILGEPCPFWALLGTPTAAKFGICWRAERPKIYDQLLYDPAA